MVIGSEESFRSLLRRVLSGRNREWSPGNGGGGTSLFVLTQTNGGGENIGEKEIWRCPSRKGERLTGAQSTEWLNYDAFFRHL